LETTVCGPWFEPGISGSVHKEKANQKDADLLFQRNSLKAIS